MKKAADRNVIVESVRKAGIVGAGGAGFPTHAKLSGRAGIVIANGAECEPLLESDRHLMLNEMGNVVAGLKIAMNAVGAGKGIIAVKRKHADIMRLLYGSIEKGNGIEALELDNFYPAGDEHVLVYETTGRTVPMGGIPPDIGVAVCNVHTLALVAGAMEGRSFTHRYVTVTGNVKRPAVAKLPLGISIGDAINAVSGGMLSDGCVVITGGPMTGKVAEKLSDPVTKTTGGILVLPAGHRLAEMKTRSLKSEFRIARSVCCQCSRCTESCPRFLLGHKLEPHKLMRILRDADGRCDEKNAMMASLCSECGLCGFYSCTMGLMPNRVNSFLKGFAAGKSDTRAAITAMTDIHPLREFRKIPATRLLNRLGLAGYDRHLPLECREIKPSKLILPLKQHIGAPSLPTVNEGDKVTAGETIAAAPDKTLGADIHCPLDGTVRSVTDKIVIECG